jgi:glycine/D-amino acid oxidase-like deaminating enzyme
VRIAVLGGGPGGLLAALLAKRGDPSREVTVFERNRAGDTFGFGVVFSDASGWRSWPSCPSPRWASWTRRRSAT